MRIAFLAALAALTFPLSAWANCSHHSSGGSSSSGSTSSSGPDWNATCIRWERITDGGEDGGPGTATEVAAQDGPSDGGTDGLTCVETATYGPSFGCGCETVTTALGASLLALMRLVRRRRSR